MNCFVMSVAFVCVGFGLLCLCHLFAVYVVMLHCLFVGVFVCVCVLVCFMCVCVFVCDLLCDVVWCMLCVLCCVCGLLYVFLFICDLFV